MRRLLALAIALVAFATAPALARDHIDGVVLMAPAGATVYIHHDAFAGMPSMSMPFMLPPGTKLEPGQHIAADVDRSSDPWKLSNVRITAGPVVQHLNLPHFINVGDAMPDLPVVDEAGRHATLAALHGRPYALTFIYTRCRDPRMCPLVSAKVERVQSITRGSAAQLVEVSLDPAYDRPAVLAKYGKMYGADFTRWHLFTGDPKTVLDFAARFRILERSAGPDTIVHTERLAIVDRNGHIVRFYDDARWSAGDVARALQANPGAEL